MMTKKDYIRAAECVRNAHMPLGAGPTNAMHRDMLRDAFVAFFQGDNPRFDVARFTLACNDGLVSARTGTKARKVLP